MAAGGRNGDASLPTSSQRNLLWNLILSFIAEGLFRHTLRDIEYDR